MKSHWKVKFTKNTYIVLAAFIVLGSILVSKVAFNDSLQIRAIGLLISGLILWISEALPMSIATLTLVFLMPFLGLMDYNDIIENFGLGTSLFIMASSGITVAIASSNIPNNITAFVFKKSQNHPRLLVFTLGMAITIFSGFVSSLATCTLFASLVTTTLKKADIKPQESNLGKALMLIIPACAGIGGFISPAGTPANILVIDILKTSGIDISFGKWFLIGAPISLLMSTIFLLSVIIVVKPEKIQLLSDSIPTKLEKKDFTILSVIVFVVLGWFMSSIMPILTTTGVAILGLSVLFVPKLDILNLRNFSRGVNWDLVFTMGSVSVLMTGISETGIITEIIESIFSSIMGAPDILILISVSLVICVIRAFIPTTTAVVALIAPMLVGIANITTLEFAPMLMVVAFWAATALLLVHTEPIYLITYKDGFYKQKDLLYTGIIPSLLGGTVITVRIYYLTSYLI